VGLGLGPEFLGEGRSISDLSCWGIFVLFNISLSRVKGIVGKIRVEFQNGNEGLGVRSRRASGKPVTSGGLASHPFRKRRGKDGAPFFYMWLRVEIGLGGPPLKTHRPSTPLRSGPVDISPTTGLDTADLLVFIDLSSRQS
jgi:hypothetical protein